MVVAMGEIRVKAVSFGHKQGPTRSAIREPSRHAALTVASESIVRQFMAPRVLRTTVSCTPQRKGYAHNPKPSTEAV